MNISITLEDILHNCDNWEDFCDKKGWSEWVVNEGGGDIEVDLTIEEAKEFGIL